MKDIAHIYRSSDPGTSHMVVCDCGARLPAFSEDHAEIVMAHHIVKFHGGDYRADPETP